RAWCGRAAASRCCGTCTSSAATGGRPRPSRRWARSGRPRRASSGGTSLRGGAKRSRARRSTRSRSSTFRTSSAPTCPGSWSTSSPGATCASSTTRSGTNCGASPQRHTLQVERGLRDARVPDRGVPLLGQLELEPCHLGDLTRDPGESLLDTLPELVVNCEVAALHVDPHPASCPFWRVRNGWYGRARRLPRASYLAGVLAYAMALTASAPAVRSAAAQAATVAP